MKNLKTHKTFEGQTQFWEHDSELTKTKMKFSTFIPKGKVHGCIFWLSGLTCTDENFITKAGAQKFLAQAGLMVVCPDTSPRGLNLPQEHDSYDFGSGASFYVDAVTPGYKDHYRMFSYITEELYTLIKSNFPVQNKISIMGHSMGGHGALTIGLKAADKFKSVSAFSPIVNPMNCAWGQKAFMGYFGEDQNLWKLSDSCELLKAGKKHPAKILIHQGTKDEFLEKQLLTKNWIETSFAKGQDSDVRYSEDYDHSYYFISTFIEDHIRHHENYLKNS